jgi:Cu/Ag efflux protein CusF
MTLHPLRHWALAIAQVFLTACMSPGVAEDDQSASAVPLGIDLGSSSITSRAGSNVVPPGEGHERATDLPRGMKMAHEGHKDVPVTGIVNTVDPAQRKLNISHNPIPEIGWPAMTMDFAVAPSVDLRSIRPGARVNFTMEQGEGAMYVIQSIAPAGGGQR